MPASSGGYTVYVNTTDKAGAISESNIAAVQGSAATLDAFTQLGWKGPSESGGNFSISQNETVYIYVEVTNASDIPQGGQFVSYEIHWPANGSQHGTVYNIGTSITNASGVAVIWQIPLLALQNQGRNPQGMWLVYVTASIDDQPLSDTLTFFVQQ